MEKQTLVLIRGIPGSGKTTYAKYHFPEYECVAADDWFHDEKGVYRFNPTQLKEAHSWCLNKAKSWLEEGKSVVVTNTFIKNRDLTNYIALKSPTIDLQVVRLTTWYANTHNVPMSKIERMCIEMEPYPSEQVIHGYISPTLHIITRKGDKLTKDEHAMWMSLTEQRELVEKLYSKRLASLTNNLKYLASVLTTYSTPLRDELCNVLVVRKRSSSIPLNQSYILTRQQTMPQHTKDLKRIDICIKDSNGNECTIIECSSPKYLPGCIRCMHDPLKICQAITESLEVYPRKYLFCNPSKVTQPMDAIEYAYFFSTIYSDFGKQWSIVMSRRSFMGHIGRRYMEDLDGDEMDKLCGLMMLDPDMIWFYRVFGVDKW